MTVATPGDPLTYNVARLILEPPGASRTYLVGGVMLDLGPDLEQTDPLEGTIRIARTNRGVLVTGRLTTAIAAECSRCLRDIEAPLTLEIGEEALPSIDIATGLPVARATEPDVLRLTDHHELALEPVVRDAISLAEPIAPLCREDCPGLCPVCGEELDGGSHAHPDELLDARLEALRGFRVDAELETR